MHSAAIEYTKCSLVGLKNTEQTNRFARLLLNFFCVSVFPQNISVDSESLSDMSMSSRIICGGASIRGNLLVMQSCTHELGVAQGVVNNKGIIQGANLTKLHFLSVCAKTK